MSFLLFLKRLKRAKASAKAKPKWPSWKQWKYLGEILNKKEKKIIRLLLLIFFLSLFSLTIHWYFLNSQIVPRVSGHHVEGLVGEIKILNPLFSNNEVDLSINKLIFSGLLKKDVDLNLIPDLVKDFNPRLIENQTYDFCLRENLFWHDKEKITSADIVFNLNLIKNVLALSKFKKTEINLINENCFQIKTDDWNLLTTGLLPKHIWQEIEEENLTTVEFNLKPIGSGPYQFDSLTKTESGEIKSYHLKRNEKYYLTGPFLKNISFRFYSDFEQAHQALKNQKINGLICSSSQFEQNLTEVKGIKNYQLNLPYYTAIFFNLRYKEGENNPLGEKSVRQALAHLTPKQEIFEQVLHQQGFIVDGPILPFSEFFNPEIKKYSYDPSLAREILVRAGWRKNDQGFFAKNGEILEISLTTIKGTEFEKIAELIQKSWQQIGLKIKLIVIPSEQIKEVIKNYNFQGFLYGILENRHPDPFSLWHSSQSNSPGLNLTGFNYRRADELLEKISLDEDPLKKKEYYLEFQEIITDNLPAIFLFNTNYNYLIDREINEIKIDQIVHPADRFNQIEKWYIKTKRIQL